MPLTAAFRIESGAAVLRVQAEVPALLQTLDRVRLESVPLGGNGARSLELTRVVLDLSATEVWVDGELASIGLELAEWSAWKGTVVGEAHSKIFLSVSRHGAFGWIRTEDELYHVLSYPGDGDDWSQVETRVVTDATLAASLRRAPP